MNSIVIIEDHPVMRKGLAGYFAGTGRWRMLGTAANLEEARKLLSFPDTSGTNVRGTLFPDVVLLDLQLGKEWGLDIIHWLDTRSAPKRPAVAVYSTFDDYTNIMTAYNMGVRAYVCKDRREAELEAALIIMLKTGSFIDETFRDELAAVTNKLNRFTKREAEIFGLVKKGLSNVVIAETLGINHRTVDNILSCIYDKTGVKSRLDLMKW
jgi:NarL family two-component system response regulator LiaR